MLQWCNYFRLAYIDAAFQKLYFKVICDRHFGGINYPVGGVGKIPLALVEGLKEHGGLIEYKANVKKIITENGKAVSKIRFLK